MPEAGLKEIYRSYLVFEEYLESTHIYYSIVHESDESASAYSFDTVEEAKNYIDNLLNKETNA